MFISENQTKQTEQNQINNKILTNNVNIVKQNYFKIQESVLHKILILSYLKLSNYVHVMFYRNYITILIMLLICRANLADTL